MVRERFIGNTSGRAAARGPTCRRGRTASARSRRRARPARRARRRAGGSRRTRRVAYRRSRRAGRGWCRRSRSGTSGTSARERDGLPGGVRDAWSKSTSPASRRRRSVDLGDVPLVRLLQHLDQVDVVGRDRVVEDDADPVPADVVEAPPRHAVLRSPSNACVAAVLGRVRDRVAVVARAHRDARRCDHGLRVGAARPGTCRAGRRTGPGPAGLAGPLGVAGGVRDRAPPAGPVPVAVGDDEHRLGCVDLGPQRGRIVGEGGRVEDERVVVEQRRSAMSTIPSPSPATTTEPAASASSRTICRRVSPGRPLTGGGWAGSAGSRAPSRR